MMVVNNVVCTFFRARVYNTIILQLFHIGGSDSAGAARTDVYAYDPRSNNGAGSWKPASPLPYGARYLHACTAYTSTTGLLCGGSAVSNHLRGFALHLTHNKHLQSSGAPGTNACLWFDGVIWNLAPSMSYARNSFGLHQFQGVHTSPIQDRVCSPRRLYIRTRRSAIQHNWRKAD